MTKIYTVRHAESIANAKGIYQGQTYDTDLSSLGEKQAEALAVRLKEKGIKRIIASSLRRTMQTAEKVSKVLGIPVEKDIRIIETNHGKWEGYDTSWVKNNYSETFSSWKNDPLHTKFPEGEEYFQITERVKEFIAKTVWNKTTLVLTHDNIIRIMICMAKEISINSMWDIKLDPTGISMFEITVNGEKRLELLEINDLKHINDLRSNIEVHAL